MKIAIYALLQYAPVVSLLLAYAAAAVLAGIGFLQMVRFQRGDAPRIERLGLAFTLGQGLVGTLWQVLASISMFSRWWVIGALVLVSAGGVAAYRRDPSAWLSLPSAFRRPALTAATVLTAAATVLMALNFLMSLLPPGTDAMAFYISQPKLIAALGSFVPLSGYQAFAQIGLAAEMHYGAFFLLGGEHAGELAGKAFVWMTGAASLVVLSGLARLAGLGPFGRAVTVAIAVSGTAFTLVLWDGKTDLVPNALALAAIYGVLLQQANPARTAITGLAAGMACVGKLSFIPSFGVTLFVLFLRQALLAPGWPARLVRDGAATVAWFLLPVAALILKNAMGYGEPFAPFLLLHPGPKAELDQVWFSPDNTWWIVATYPLALTFGQYPMQHGNVGVPVLAALPFLLVPALRRSVGSTALWMGVAGLAGVLAWVALRPSVLAPRYILPCLFLLAPVSAAVVAWIWEHGRTAARCVLAAAALMLLVPQAGESLSTVSDNRYYLLALPKTSTHPIWRTADAANTSSRGYVRVMNLMYYSSMYSPGLLACMKAVDVRDLKGISQTSRQFWEWAYRHGVTHVSFDRLTHAPLLGTTLDPTDSPDWLTVRETRIVDRFSSFELVAGPSAPAPDETCNSVSGPTSRKGAPQ
jgi:hypothetical protein